MLTAPVDVHELAEHCVKAIARSGFEDPARRSWQLLAAALNADEDEVDVRSWVMATASDGRPILSEGLHWELGGDGLEPGGDVRAVPALWQGEHVAVLHARDGDQRSKVPVVFQATGSGRAARQAEGG